MISIIKTGYTQYLPAVLARPAQPYIAPRPAWTEYRRVETCSTEPPTTVWTEVITPRWECTTSGGVEVCTVVYKASSIESVVPGKRTCSYSTVTVNHPASPGQPYLPAVNAQLPRVAQNRRLGWNSGAVSVNSVSGAGGYTFKVPTDTIGAVVGFTTESHPTHSGQIRHGLYLSRGVAQAMESGALVGSSSGYTDSSVLAVQRKMDGTVVYLIGGTALHTSTAPSTGRVSLGAVLYSAGDSVVDAANKYILPNTGTAYGDMPPMLGFSANYATGSSSASMLPMRPGAGSGSVGRMAILDGLASSRPYGEASNAMMRMSGIAYGPTVTPGYAVAEHSLFPMQGFSTGVEIVPTSVFGFVRPMGGLASSGAYGEVDGSISPATGFASGRNLYNVMDAAIVAGVRTVEGSGQRKIADSGDIMASPRLVAGAFGGRSTIAGAARTATGAGTTTSVVRGELVAQPRTVSGYARISETSRSRLLRGVPGIVSGWSGGACALRAAPRTTGGFVLRGSVGRAALRMPNARTSGQVAQQAWSYGALIGAPGRVIQGGRAAIVRSPAILSGVLVGARTFGGAYVITVETAEGTAPPVTRYTAYPFVNVVRFRGKNYGVSASGLYDLSGDSDDGQVIAWSFTLTAGDFQKPTRKSVASAYFSGNLSAGQLTFSVSANSSASYQYTPSASCVGRDQNHRVRFGLGNSDRFSTIGVAGASKAVFNTMDFEILESKRRLT